MRGYNAEEGKKLFAEYLAILILVQVIILGILIYALMYSPTLRENKPLAIAIIAIVGIFLAIIWPIILGRWFSRKV